MPAPYLPKPVREMLAEAVAATEAKVLSQLKAADPLIMQLHCLIAPPDEVIETLQEMTTTQGQQQLKYPLIAFFEDFRFHVGSKLGYYGTIVLNGIVATETVATYKSWEREEKSFVPILRPAYNELVNQLRLLPYVAQEQSLFNHTMWERKRWGRDGLYNQAGNLFADRIDAIEFQDLEITLRADGGASQNISNFRH